MAAPTRAMVARLSHAHTQAHDRLREAARLARIPHAQYVTMSDEDRLAHVIDEALQLMAPHIRAVVAREAAAIGCSERELAAEILGLMIMGGGR